MVERSYKCEDLTESFTNILEDFKTIHSIEMHLEGDVYRVDIVGYLKEEG